MMNMSRLVLFLIVLTLSSMPVMAKNDQDKQYLLTEKTYKALSSAQELMAAESYSDAQAKLNALIKQTPEGSYDRAVVEQTLGYLFSSNQDYNNAAIAFKKALASNALPEKISHDLRYNLAQILLADEDYKAGIALLEQWLKSEKKPPNSAYVLLASANYRIKNYKSTITHITTAIKNDASAKEAWYQLLLSAHLELKQYKAAIKVLETLITHYPYKQNYWQQLTALYLQQNKEFSALAVKSLAQRLELGDSKTLISLADLYRYLAIPFKSAQLLSDAMNKGIIQANSENLNRLADSWLAAKETEKAAEVLEKIAQLEDSGEAYLKYGRVLFALEQWQKASEPLAKSVEKLKDDKKGAALLLLGMTQFHLGELTQAKSLFSKAVAYENERFQAGQWLRHVEQQLEVADNES